MTERIEGDERERLIDLEEGGCHCCGFMEEGLLVFRQPHGAVAVSCQECHDQNNADDNADLVLAYLPEMNPASFSHYVRVLAFLTFAARAEALDGHDFSRGTLPPRFCKADGWSAPLRWPTLSEGLEHVGADCRSREDLVLAKQAFEFLRGRTEHAKRLMGNGSRSGLHMDDFRAMSPGICLDRIRSWGKSGSSFRIVGRR